MDVNDSSTVDKLIQLSKIFKKGYTIALRNNKIEQINVTKGYIISYRTVVTINFNNNTSSLYKCKIPSNTIIGGWFNKSINMYYIELATIYKYKNVALKNAKKHKQEYIYDLNKQVLIKVV